MQKTKKQQKQQAQAAQPKKEEFNLVVELSPAVLGKIAGGKHAKKA